MNAVLLQVDNVSVQFTGLIALSNVSFSLSKGTVLGMLGPNGAGKSTLFDAVTGKVQVSQGSVRLHGEDLAGLSSAERARRGISRTFQLGSMVPELSVAENIVLGLDHRSRSGVDAELKNRKAYGSALNQTLDLFELGDVRDVEINVLSSGVQRIVEVARCVASGSDVVLLDEPGVGLTTRERSQLKAVIRRLADEGRSVLLVEHDTNIVFDTADSVMVLDKGELIAHGSSSSIRSDPKVREAYLGEG